MSALKKSASEEGEIKGSSVELAIVGKDTPFRVLSVTEVEQYLEEVKEWKKSEMVAEWLNPYQYMFYFILKISDLKLDKDPQSIRLWRRIKKSLNLLFFNRLSFLLSFAFLSFYLCLLRPGSLILMKFQRFLINCFPNRTYLHGQTIKWEIEAVGWRLKRRFLTDLL